MLISKLVCSECSTVNDTDAKFCKCCGVGGKESTAIRKAFDEEVSRRAQIRLDEPVWETRGKCKKCGGVLLGTYCGKCDIFVLQNDVSEN